MDKNEQPIAKIKGSRSVNFGFSICIAGIVLIGLVSWIYEYIHQLS